MLQRALATTALVVAGAACGRTLPAGPVSPSPPQVSIGAAYLETVLATMSANSVNRQRIDWPRFNAEVRAAAVNVQDIAGTAPALRIALGLLGDGHSFFQWSNGETVANPAAPDCRADADGAPNIPLDIGYVAVRALFGANAPSPQSYADALNAAIDAQDRPGLAGWIVDVRGNGGGNMWPMIGGLAPLLGSDTAGYFAHPGGVMVPWRAAGRSATLRQPHPRVAVLTDRATASSGEAVVVAFRGRPDSRSFGEATCGVPTSNTAFALSDGSTLWLTTALDADRHARTYSGPIVPDEVVAGRAVIARAIDWLRLRGRGTGVARASTPVPHPIYSSRVP